MPEAERAALLAYDLGTTRLKVAAFDIEGRLLARESARHVEHRDGDHAWQSPDAWWDDAAALTRRLLTSPALASRSIAGVSLSGRAAAAVFVDAAGEVLAGSWLDSRHQSHLDALFEWRRGGGSLSNYAAAPIAKATWLRQTDPATFERVRHVLYAKDFLMYRLTGEAVTDPSSGPDADDFDPAVFAHTGLPRDLFPRVASPWSIGGRVTPAAARETGLPEGAPVAVGAHDGVCANVGAGAGRPGAYAVTIGTHAVVRAVTSEMPEGAYRFYGMPPDRHVIGGNALMAGRAADWFLDTWLDYPPESERGAAFARMEREAAASRPGARGVRFAPYLGGQVAPERRPGATGAFTGLRAWHARSDLYRAVLEGGAFAVGEVYEQVRGWCGEPSVVRFTGGGARSATWRQAIVARIGRPCEVTDHAEEARGAAIYLAVALGYYPGVDAAADAMVRVTHVEAPDPALVERYAELYESWRDAVDALRALDDGRDRAPGGGDSVPGGR